MNTTTSIKFNEEVCSLTSHRKAEPYTSKREHTLVSISNPFDPEELNWNGITQRPEYSNKGEDKDNDKLWRKYNKAELGIQRVIINQAVKDGLLDENIAKELKWSRTAMCSCGCSPSWVSKDYGRQTIWLTVTSPSKEQEKKQRQLEYASKKESETLSSMMI
jgi:hypothetical protein